MALVRSRQQMINVVQQADYLSRAERNQQIAAINQVFKKRDVARFYTALTAQIPIALAAIALHALYLHAGLTAVQSVGLTIGVIAGGEVITALAVKTLRLLWAQPKADSLANTHRRSTASELTIKITPPLIRNAPSINSTPADFKPFPQPAPTDKIGQREDSSPQPADPSMSKPKGNLKSLPAAAPPKKREQGKSREICECNFLVGYIARDPLKLKKRFGQASKKASYYVKVSFPDQDRPTYFPNTLFKQITINPGTEEETLSITKTGETCTYRLPRGTHQKYDRAEKAMPLGLNFDSDIEETLRS